MPFDVDDAREAEELNRQLDARVLGLDGADGELSLFERLAECDDAPLPDEAVVSRVRASVLATPKVAAQPSRHAVGIVKAFPAAWPVPSLRRIAAAVAIAAVLTLMASTGNGILKDQANAPTVASVLASPASTPTVAPTSTVWLESTTVSVNHGVTLLPDIAATATNGDVVGPPIELTVLESRNDDAGRAWLLVETSDGQTGWLPRDTLQTLGQ